MRIGSNPTTHAVILGFIPRIHFQPQTYWTSAPSIQSPRELFGRAYTPDDRTKCRNGESLISGQKNHATSVEMPRMTQGNRKNPPFDVVNKQVKTGDAVHISQQNLKARAESVFRMQHSYLKTHATASNADFTIDVTGAIRNCPIALGAIHPAAWPTRRHRPRIGGFDPVPGIQFREPSCVRPDN